MFTRIIEGFHRAAASLAALSPIPPGRSRAAWMTSLGGFRGPQALQMEIYRLGEALPSGAGVFVFAGHNSRRWTALYAGETTDLRTRAPGHEALPEALLLGATHVHIARIEDPNVRRSAAERLVFMYGPPMNSAGAPLLAELIATGRRHEPEPQETPRLAVAS